MKFLVTGSFGKWIVFMYHRLQDLQEKMDDGDSCVDAVEEIRFVWNDLFAVINNESDDITWDLLNDVKMDVEFCTKTISKLYDR